MINEFAQMDLALQDLTFSPITGADGNVEYLIYACQGASPAKINIEEIITAAYTAL